VLADKKEDTIKDKCSFNINDTRRDFGLSDAKMSKKRLKIGKIKPFKAILK